MLRLLLILTTATHFATISVSPNLWYSVVITTGTVFSILWHAGLDSFFWLDHITALIWTLSEFTLIPIEDWLLLVALDAILLLVNWSIPTNSWSHAAWHLAHAFKTWWLAAYFMHSRRPMHRLLLEPHRENSQY